MTLKVVDATMPLKFEITKQNVASAKCKDPKQCVIAQAMRAALGDYIEEFEVGAFVTKVTFAGRVVRYRTPIVLARALRHFDRTGRWDLPPGMYGLRPLSASRRLGQSAGRTKNGKANPKAPKKRQSLPTRFVDRVIVKAAP